MDITTNQEEYDETGKICCKCNGPATHKHLDDGRDWCDKCCIAEMEKVDEN